MRLSAFFAKPAPPSAVKSSGGSNPPSPHKSSTGEVVGSTTPNKEPAKVVSDYHKDFPEFFLQSHTTLAPQHRFERDLEATEHIRQKLDGLLKGSNEAAPPPNSFRPSELFNIIPYRRRRGRNVVPVKEILRKLQDDANSVDLTGEAGETGVQSHPRELLKRVRMKILRFGEDIRPPYQGTFTRAIPSTTAVKLCRDPFSRALPDTNYDYDSEAEWEEPEEGEDLDSEGEDDASEDGDDDMEGFLDDDEDNLVDGRRRLIAGDLEPVCTGIRWQEESDLSPEMQAYRMEIISGKEQGKHDTYTVFPCVLTHRARYRSISH
jgi:chromatin assembly factor 1 subunit A